MVRLPLGKPLPSRPHISKRTVGLDTPRIVSTLSGQNTRFAFKISKTLFPFLPRTIIAARRRSGAPSKVYQWLGVATKCRSNILQIAPLIFTGRLKSAKFGLDFRHQSPLKSCSFETEQHVGNLKHVTGA